MVIFHELRGGGAEIQSLTKIFLTIEMFRGLAMHGNVRLKSEILELGGLNTIWRNMTSIHCKLFKKSLHSTLQSSQFRSDIFALKLL